MKRIALVLCLVLICSLLFVGCGDNDDGDVTPSTLPQDTNSPGETDKDDDVDILPDDDDKNGILPDDEDNNGILPDDDDIGTAEPGTSPTASPAA